MTRQYGAPVAPIEAPETNATFQYWGQMTQFAEVCRLLLTPHTIVQSLREQTLKTGSRSLCSFIA